MIYIYALSDPETFKIRYIGKTINIKARLENHISRSKNFKTSRHVCNWIKSLLNKKLKPILTVIDTTDEENWVSKEMYWIKHFKDLGLKLCNHNAGGKSNTGYKPNKATIKKMKAAHLGHPVENSTREKIRATLSRSVICIETGVKYTSIKEAVKDSGIPKTTFHRKFHAGKQINNKTYKYG
jgi:hypothetical protein